MNRNFNFNWYENAKYGNPYHRTNMVKAQTAQDATSVFVKNFGNLKKNTIIFIQEVDNNGNNIGEPIIPD